MSVEGGSSRQNVFLEEDFRAWQQQLARGVLRALVVIGPLAAMAGSYYDFVRQVYWTIPLYWGAYAVLLLITFWHRVPYGLQASTIMLLIYGLAILDFLSDGRGGSGRLFFLILLLMAGIFFGIQVSALCLMATTLTAVGMAWAYASGYLVVPVLDSAQVSGWVSNILVLIMLGTFIIVAQNRLVPRLVAALDHTRSLAAQLEEERSRLEMEVNKRTADLQERSIQLQTAAHVARDAAQIQDVDRLLNEAVRLISDRFGFYHAGIFLLEDAGPDDPEGVGAYAVLCAASSAGGQRMLARQHRLRLGRGLVGTVAMQGQPRVALDVGADAVFFNNPDLPQTHSEMALPLQSREEIIGVLDVQSQKTGAFGDEDVAVLQTLADQLAIAISNARLFQQAQVGLDAERRAYGRLSLEAWQQLVRVQPKVRQHRYDPQGILPGDGAWRPEMEDAVRQGELVPGAYQDSPTLSVPLKVRDQVIGVLDAHKPAEAGGWTAEEMGLLQTLVDRLGVALDSARLYQDAQRLAARERLVADITSHMRQTLDVDTVLQTAAQEMRGVLDLAEVELRIHGGGSEPDLEGSFQ